LHNSSSGNSSSEEEMSQHHSINHLMDKHHLMHVRDQVTDSTASGQSLDTTNLLHLGSFGIVSLKQVSSFG